MGLAWTIAHRVVDVAGVFAILCGLYLGISIVLIACSEDPLEEPAE